MTAIKHIVAASDLSAASRHAIERAALLARSQQASLTLVHVLPDGVWDDFRRWVSDAEHAAIAESEARERLHALGGELRKRFGIEVSEAMPSGHPLREISRLAEEADADLIVTGRRSAGILRGAVIGSTAERLAHRAARPVLVARNSAKAAYQRVLVPVDFSDWSLHAVLLAQRVAPGVPVVLMHAVETPLEGRMRLAGVSDTAIAHYRGTAMSEARVQLDQLAVRSGLPPDRVLVATPSGANPWMLIAEQEQEHDCDLIVIGRCGRHALEEALLGSTTRMVLAECSADVLVSVHSGVA